MVRRIKRLLGGERSLDPSQHVSVLDPAIDELVHAVLSDTARALSALAPGPLPSFVPLLLADVRAGMAADEGDDRRAMAVVELALPRNVEAEVRMIGHRVDEVGLVLAPLRQDVRLGLVREEALLDALTIRRTKGRIQRLTVAICGDIANSRVARSNMLCLNALENRVRVIAPPTLLPSGIDRFGVEVFTDMEEGLKGCDVVMMLRLQKERMDGAFIPSEREYYHRFGLDSAKLAHAKEDAIVMHPGPMNRGVEIDGTIADDINRSVIQEQVEMGVAVRMAAMKLLADNLKAARAAPSEVMA